MAGRPNPYPMGVSDPLPAGRVISFGSLEFRATGNGYLMQLLSPGRDPVTPTLPARRDRRSGQRSRQARAERRRVAGHNSPTWVEAGISQLSITANEATASLSRAPASLASPPSSAAAPVLPRGVRPRHHPSLSGCVTLPPASFRSALTSPGVRICWITIFGRFTASSRRLLANPTLRRRA